MGEYVPDLVPDLEPRTDIKPLHVTQPEGPSFTLVGDALSWQSGRCASASTTARAW